MTAHELAKLLLDGPDLPVFTEGDGCYYYQITGIIGEGQYHGYNGEDDEGDVTDVVVLSHDEADGGLDI